MQFGISPHAFVVGSVGRLAPEKNQAVLIDAVAELRSRSLDAHLLLVGEGTMRSELQRRAEERGIRPHVTFAGAQRDVRPALSAMDVFVLPSTHIETFSNAALEAMAMCKPVVLSRIGGAVEMVREGMDGVTLDTTSLATSLPSLLARLQADRAWREGLGQAARIRVIQRFSLHTMVERYASLMNSDLELGLTSSGQS
jgi:glycosyltransferase involved in cell wall biosynthesis